MSVIAHTPIETTGHIRWFEDVDRQDIAAVGGKGANLGEMAQAGLPVPPGFILAGTAYRSVVEGHGLAGRIAARLQGLPYEDIGAISAASQEIMAWVQACPVPPHVREAIEQAYAHLAQRLGAPGNNIPVAVRSSATAEDLPCASFAGQQETFLNVCSAPAVVAAVRRCWASLWTPQAISDRASQGFDQLSVDLAVVVQAMAPAEVAGVMFTANPVSGARDELLISASYGLGEAVVSGAVTPDTFVLGLDGRLRQQTLGAKEMRIRPNGCGTKQEATPLADRQRYCLQAADLAGLADMARRVQAHYGSPQDTEWALSQGRLYLLQARPITTLDREMPQAAQDVPPPGELPVMARPPRGIENIIDHMPEPPYPLDMGIICNDAFYRFFAGLGMRMPERPSQEVERSDGRMAMFMPEPGLSPAFLWKFPAHLVWVLRHDPMAHWQPLAAQIARWVAEMEQERRAIENAPAPDAPALARLIVRSLDEFEALLALRYRAAFFPGFVYLALVSFWVRRAVGKAAAPELDDRLYRATPYPTSLQNLDMAQLARLQRRNGRESSAFQAALKAFLARYGNRPVRGMIALPSSPSWAEQPEIVLGMIDALQASPAALEEHAQEEYEAARRQVEAKLPAVLRGWFRHHLDRSRKALVVREQGLSLSEDYMAFVRRAVLQLGQYLADQGVLSQPDEVHYLLFSELEAAARGQLPDLPERVQRRKQGYRRVQAAHARGRHWLYATGSLPPLTAETIPPLDAPGQAPSLRGLAASRGQAVAPVCVIHGPEEFGKMRPGCVLVAPFTAPAWTPLFRLAAAVVTDIGSLASHAAIVAREYGVPCVVAAAQATSRLQDGQMVRVDGTQGTVTLVDQPAEGRGG